MLQTASLSEQIEEALRQEILSGRLAPGQRIDISKLCAAWDVSSTPIRDAVRRLEMRGLVEVSPRRGVFVSTFDSKTFKNVFDLRIAIECLAVELATPLIPTDEIERAIKIYEEAGRYFRETGDRAPLIEHEHLIHDLILHYCDNPRLAEIMAGLQDLINWARMTSVRRHPRSYELALPEHLAILYALRQRDVAKGQALMRAHLKSSFDRTQEIA